MIAKYLPQLSKWIRITQWIIAIISSCIHADCKFPKATLFNIKKSTKFYKPEQNVCAVKYKKCCLTQIRINSSLHFSNYYSFLFQLFKESYRIWNLKLGTWTHLNFIVPIKVTFYQFIRGSLWWATKTERKWCSLKCLFFLLILNEVFISNILVLVKRLSNI